MTSREDIIRRIRDANLDVMAQPVVRSYARESSLSRGEVLDLFVERVSDYGAKVVSCTLTDATDAIVTELWPFEPESVLLGRGLDPKWCTAGVMDASFTNFELDRFEAVVTTCAVSIAQTGTIILDHRDDGQGRRAVSLLPDRHVCIVSSSQIVHLVPEALHRLDPRRPLTWISGPSATSDIELERVGGVHGPRDLRVIVVHETG